MRRRPRSVLVTDGEQRAALAVVRSLGTCGWSCVVGSAFTRSLAGASRYTTLEVALPDATTEPERFAEQVAFLVKQHAIDVVIPIAEPSMLAVLAAKSRIPATIPFPDLAIFEAICDKDGLLETAQELGIRVPAQQRVGHPSSGTEDTLRFPLVLKPHRSVCTDDVGERVKVGVKWAYDHAELQAHLLSFPPAAFPILLQEAVVGPGVGVFVLIDEGEVVARFSHRRIREKPPSGGVSVVRQSETMDESLFRASVALLKHYGWSGVAMVEYKIDQDTSEPVLMEVNGRFWGSLQLAIDAGVDFPRLLVDGRDPGLAAAGPPEYRFVRNRWFWGDVDHLLAVWRDTRCNWRERLLAVAAWISAFLPGYREEIFRWSDPHPFIRETASWFRQVLRV